MSRNYNLHFNPNDKQPKQLSSLDFAHLWSYRSYVDHNKNFRENDNHQN